MSGARSSGGLRNWAGPRRYRAAGRPRWSLRLHGPETNRDFQVHHGPIGSGNAVISDSASQIRGWLRHYNDKILAIDMEASGFAMACHDDPDSTPPPWLVIRGISDDASPTKNDDHHQAAAIHAALTLREILPYLPLQHEHPTAR
jgi:adenosylhomocysteine nucleosidase